MVHVCLYIYIYRYYTCSRIHGRSLRCKTIESRDKHVSERVVPYTCQMSVVRFSRALVREFISSPLSSSFGILLFIVVLWLLLLLLSSTLLLLLLLLLLHSSSSVRPRGFHCVRFYYFFRLVLLILRTMQIREKYRTEKKKKKRNAAFTRSHSLCSCCCPVRSRCEYQ